MPLSGPVDTVQLSDLDCSFKKHYKQSNPNTLKIKANTANMDRNIEENADSKKVDTVQLRDLDCIFKKYYKQSNLNTPKTKANTANMDMTIVGNADSKNKGR